MEPRVPVENRDFRPRAFTLVELLVVIAIIGILIGLLLPAINAAREAGRWAQCSNNLKQIGLGFNTYEGTMGLYPPGRAGYDNNGTAKGAASAGTSGFVYILPYIEENSAYKAFMPFAKGAIFPVIINATSTGWETPAITQALQTRPKTFVCPTDQSKALYTGPNSPVPTNGATGYPTGCYALMMGSNGPPLFAITDEVNVKQNNNGMFVYVKGRTAQKVTRGLAHTIFAGETTNNDSDTEPNRWMYATRLEDSLRGTCVAINTPVVGTASNGAYSSKHPSGANFVFGDGHVIYIGDDIDMPTCQTMSHIVFMPQQGDVTQMYAP